MKNINIYKLLSPIFLKLNPEFAHNKFLSLASYLEKLACFGFFTASPLEKDKIQLGTLNFKNRVGLAAGLDKNAAYIDALSWLGFGFIEVGTVTPKPQSGNPKPRLFRLAKNKALINRMGFNNNGLDTFIKNLKKSKWIKQKKGIVGINLGINFDTKLENANQDYEIGLEATYQYADYIVINISSPNTQGLRKLQEKILLEKLLTMIKKKQKELFKKHLLLKPIFIKISPDIDIEYLESTIKLINHYNIDGVIATNTTTERIDTLETKYSQEPGGLSGLPLLKKSNQILNEMKKNLNSDVILIGSGGIISGDDAAEKIKYGASLVQIYSGIIFQGPSLVKECIDKIEKTL